MFGSFRDCAVKSVLDCFQAFHLTRVDAVEKGIAPALWNGLPKDLRQFAHPPNPPPNLTYGKLALSSTTFHSRLKTELVKLSYPDSTPSPRHVRHHHSRGRSRAYCLGNIYHRLTLSSTI